MTTIGHFSDLHGDLRCLMSGTEIPDVWVCSGDLFPNATRGDAAVEVPFQTAWFDTIADAFIARLGGRPLVWVGGNHDYVNLAEMLASRGYPAFNATEDLVEVAGLRITGFREVPWMAGEWNGETHDIGPMVDRAFEADPTVLVTHAPPAGILDDDHGAGHGCGIRPLATALAYRPHNIQAHLFGHIHAQGGCEVEEMGVRFYNGAGTVRFIGV